MESSQPANEELIAVDPSTVKLSVAVESSAATDDERDHRSASAPTTQTITSRFTLKKIRGGSLLVLGYLLSPLCWWNDLIFNLPIAYAFGYICRWISADWFIPGLIAGYWLSNVVGILLMQFGAIDMVKESSKPHNLKQDLITGVLSSTAYTLVILILVHFNILDASAFLSDENLNQLGSFLPTLGWGNW